MRPLRPRYGRIERFVDQLLEEHQITAPAVPVEKIAKKAGVELKYGDLGEVSGLLVRAEGKATIGVNECHPPVRRRFTIAHELGHFLLHEGISAHCDRDYKVNYRSQESSQATNVEEIEANFFAASLLMPRWFLDNDNAIDFLDNDAGVARLAEKYRVSRHALSLRLVNLYGQHRPF
jgi:Zn-dependent peptidase ImmA (M78 family)